MFDLFANHGPGGISSIDGLTRDTAMDPMHRITMLTLSRLSPHRDVAKQQYEKLVRAPGLFRRNRSLAAELGIAPVAPSELTLLPAESALIHVNFKLRKPYLSKDDDTFYPIDQPVLKDRTFRIPMMAGSGWKGALRAAAASVERRALRQAASLDAVHHARLRLMLLFGNEIRQFAEPWNLLTERLGFAPAEKASEEFEKFLKSLEITQGVGRQGYLSFFPTFFDQVAFEILNPHDRTTRSGKDPVAIECVPAGSTGVWQVLFVPFDAGVRKGLPNRGELLALTLKAVERVLTRTGFGAKTSSGFGTASIEKDSALHWNGDRAHFNSAADLRALAAGSLEGVLP